MFCENCGQYEATSIDVWGNHICSVCAREDAADLESEMEYSDSQRLDEMNCVDDYNRYEENQIDLDREFE